MFVSNSGLSCIILFELNLTILINYAVSSLSTPRRISIITNHPKSLRIFKIATEGKKSQWRLLTLASFLCKLFLATPKAACITPIQTSQVLTLRYPITPCCHADTTPIWSHQNVILNGCPNIWVDVSSSNGVIYVQWLFTSQIYTWPFLTLVSLPTFILGPLSPNLFLLLRHA